MEPQLQYPRENARGLRPRRQNFAKAALRAVGRAAIGVRRSPRSPRSSPTEPNLSQVSMILRGCKCAAPDYFRQGQCDLCLRTRAALIHCRGGEHRLLMHRVSNRPSARAQLYLRRSAQGYTLPARSYYARTGEFQLARSSTARTFAAVCLSLPRSRLHLSIPAAQEIGALGATSCLPSAPAAAPSVVVVSRRAPR